MLYLTEGKQFSEFSGLGSFAEETVGEFIDGLLENNFSLPLESNPGFYFSFEDSTYQVRSKLFSAKKKREALAPLPVFGIRR